MKNRTIRHSKHLDQKDYWKAFFSALIGHFRNSRRLSIPVFVLFLSGVIFGLFVGFVWEWIREMKHRSASNRKSKDLARVENELNQLKRDTGQNEDEEAIF